MILSTLRSHFLNYLIRSVSIHTACYLLKWLNQKGYMLIQSVNISKPKVLWVTFSPMLHFFKKKNRVLPGNGLIPPPLKNFWKCPFPIINIFCKSWLEELLILSLKRIKSIQIKVLRSRDFYIETQLITLIALIAPARRSAMICYKMHFFFTALKQRWILSINLA